MTKKHLIQLADIVVNMRDISNDNLFFTEDDNDFRSGYESAVRDFEMKLKSFAQVNAKNFDVNKWHNYIAKRVSL